MSAAVAEPVAGEPTSACAGEGAPSVPTLSDRIRRRMALWWGEERGRARLHRGREILVARRGVADDPASWRCCARWQRSLNNKLTGRAFAAAHGARVPELYWAGRVPAHIPVDRLPSRFVVKPSFGRASRGVYPLSHGEDVLSGRRYDRRGLVRELQASFGRVTPIALMAEEFVRDESGRDGLPTEYKFFVFGGVVGAIEVTSRIGVEAHANPRNSYTREWKLLVPPLFNDTYTFADFPRPRCLDEMLDVALRLGRAYGGFVRVDLFASDRGAVFGEFSSTPSEGRGFEAEADRRLGQLWRDRLGDLE